MQELDDLAKQVHPRTPETWIIQLRQRLGWSETLLATERRRQTKAAKDASAPGKLALAQEELQNLGAKKKR